MAWPWTPEIPLLNDKPVFQVTATAAENAGQGCDLHAALKARPETRPDNGRWRRRYSDDTFTLGPLVDAIAQVHGVTARGTDLGEAVGRARMAFGSLHPGWRTFLELALEQYFEYHEAREQELGALRYLGLTNKVALRPGSAVMTWGPLYENESGMREIRRLRFGRAHSEHTVWADVAAYVAAELATDRPVRQVYVTEVGLQDGVERHLINGIAPEQAREGYERSVRPKARSVVEGAVRTPGHDCESCKFTGGCPDLVAVPGMLQLDAPAAWSRSVSAHDLSLHRRCPSRWYLQRQLNLPREAEDSDTLRRGTAAHAWIDQAHRRGTACELGDLPAPGAEGAGSDGLGSGGLGSGGLSEEEYRLAYPFLLRHVDVCPFREGPVDVVLAERSVHARDPEADVVVVAKPDLLIRRDGALVVRELKTSGGHLPADEREARDRYLAVVFDLALLAYGLAERYDCAEGKVELEILTPNEAAVFTYSTEDPLMAKVSREQLKAHAEEWAHDTTWDTRPGPQCAWCPVREWCPDRDAYGATVAGPPPTEDAPF
ncbi:PD-(D/E)XK nuclease family protein [Amycolatopsis antarctica]|nr:PD-(D/E)XK nuclease family protein [Amycolatopsis antarctica]